jgi:hypothetical protein
MLAAPLSSKLLLIALDLVAHLPVSLSIEPGIFHVATSVLLGIKSIESRGVCVSMQINEAILIDGDCSCNYIASVVTEVHRLLWDIFNVCSFGVVQLIGWDPKYEPVIISLILFDVIEAILLEVKLDRIGVNPAISVIYGVSKACPSLLTVHV